MEDHKFSTFKYLLIKLAIFLVFAVLIIIFTHDIVSNLRIFIGMLMVVYGVEAIIFDLIFNRKGFFHQGRNYLGFVEIILGITLLATSIDFETTCVIWATWSIIRESYEIKEIITETKCIILAIISAIETVVVIVLSIMLIINATEHHALIHCYLLVAELILTPLIPLLDEIIIHKNKK